MIVLFTDFGLNGPYTGQMKAVLYRDAPGVPVIDLFSDAPSWDPQLSAYLLAAYAAWFPAGTCFLCVVDPGVGSDRAPGVLAADGKWFVGPDNGLFEIVARRAAETSWTRISWQPDTLSDTFHGRDLFAPIAAAVAMGGTVDGVSEPASAIRRAEWPDDLARIVYIDDYGNAMTGCRASAMPENANIYVEKTRIPRARIFSDVPTGALFWYVNGNGLIEIAANKKSAELILSLEVGAEVTLGAGS